MVVRALSYDGVPAPVLAERLAVPRLALYDELGSALDEAHALGAAGAPHGTLVLADRQVAGRGRQGRPWASPPGDGIWLAYLVGGRDVAGDGVLALRVGLAVADALAVLGAAAHLKWPNDVLLAGRKVAGILCEARSGSRPWVAVGIGLNVRGPAPVAGAAVLSEALPGADRVGVLEVLVPALGRMARHGTLSAAERDGWARRDWLAGRRISAPVAGMVAGVAPDGALVVTTTQGEHRVLAGTVTCS